MQIKGAYGGAYLKNLENQKDKKLDKAGKESLKSNNVDAKVNISDTINAKAKEYSTQLKTIQTEVSNYQSMLADSGTIKQNLQSIQRNLENQSGTSSKTNLEILDNINQVLSNSLIDPGNVLANVNNIEANLNDQAIDKIPELEKALEGIEGLREGFQTKLDALNSDVKKLSIAKENSMAAESSLDRKNLSSVMQNITNQSGEAIGAQASKISQSRVFEILRTE
jgi:hypothetical protein